jgi:hypothetical protein
MALMLSSVPLVAAGFGKKRRAIQIRGPAVRSIGWIFFSSDERFSHWLPENLAEREFFLMWTTISMEAHPIFLRCGGEHERAGGDEKR